MIEEFKHPIRNSRMQLDDVYFWTDTIKDWKKLLKQDEYKNLQPWSVAHRTLINYNDRRI